MLRRGHRTLRIPQTKTISRVELRGLYVCGLGVAAVRSSTAVVRRPEFTDTGVRLHLTRCSC